MAAGRLLHEITAFICDAAPNYKKQLKPKLRKSPMKRNTISTQVKYNIYTLATMHRDNINEKKKNYFFRVIMHHIYHNHREALLKVT